MIKDGPAEARYPSGKGEVCKTFMRRFDPGPRLQNFLLKSNRISIVGCYPHLSTGVAFFVLNRGQLARIRVD